MRGLFLTRGYKKDCRKGSKVKRLPESEVILTHATSLLLLQHLLEVFVRHVEATPRKVKGPLRNKATASLSGLGRRARARANTRWASAATAPTIGPAETLSTNELLALAVADVLSSRGIERRATLESAWLCGIGRRCGLCGVCGWSCGLRSRVCRGWRGRATSETAALLALLKRSTRA